MPAPAVKASCQECMQEAWPGIGAAASTAVAGLVGRGALPACRQVEALAECCMRLEVAWHQL